MKSPEPLPSSPFPQLLLLSVISYIMEYPCGQFGSAVLVMSSPSLLLPHNLLACLSTYACAQMLSEHSSAIAKTLVCYQHNSSYNYTAQHCMGFAMGKVNPIPARLNTIECMHICEFMSDLAEISYQKAKGTGRNNKYMEGRLSKHRAPENMTLNSVIMRLRSNHPSTANV